MTRVTGAVMWLVAATILGAVPLHAYVAGPMPWVRLSDTSAVRRGCCAASRIGTTTRLADEQTGGPKAASQYTRSRELSVCRAKKKKGQAEDEDDAAALDRKLRKEIGEEKYQELVDAAEQVRKDRPCVLRHYPCCDEGTQGCNAWSSGWLTRVTSIFARRGTNSRKALWAMVLRGPQVSCPQSGSSMTTGRVYAHGGSMLALAHAGVCATCARLTMVLKQVECARANQKTTPLRFLPSRTR